jgi:outer membrane protein assembly factor BamB
MGMATMQTEGIAVQKPLQVWPGVLIVALQWLVGFALPVFVPEAKLYALLGGFLGGTLTVILWWLFFSRAPWSERLSALVFIPAAVFATSYIVHESIAGGAMGMLLYLFSLPVMSLALVAGAVAGRRLSSGPRRAVLTSAVLLGCGAFAVARTGGMSGDGDFDFHWRWSQTPEERLLSLKESASPAPHSAPTAPIPGVSWPGFRGTGRDGIVHGSQVAADWSHSKPVELWRRPVGPGWSSFAVQGDLFYTQEQRGEDEVVGCYQISTGQPVWKHRDPARFWESNAGAGPRATPTLDNGHVYTCGATGIVNALNAADGSVVWSCNATADTGAKVPHWGFAGSPLVVDDLLIVATAGKLVAYEAATGKRRWLCPADGYGYSSPHMTTIDGVKQILLLNGVGAIGVSPAAGAELWKYEWSGDGIVQPAFTADGDILLGSGSGIGDAATGVRRITVKHEPEKWAAQERWTSAGLKPYFNDLVVHKGHAFGFDGSLLACIDLANGKRKWKGGRYGHGQLILLADQDLLLVASEKGQLALVAAAPDDFKELGRVPAIEGKTWNHPVLAGDVVLIRNDQEMAAFRLPLTTR